ncbi:hypothetical protein BJ684DRAFT_15751 [Piptocephalis cylindrospora]|uniref:Uncharacterized protein n=1 Tax=Piptocephalis cylindrospora TaxID=1907219 RepID=A0A4P9Y5A9_9FUNG|nr:hypothetical protein BJ684DRAFT_15751 [Piptocephalis cylindrospora]|eukprot:RKP13892.1 hypothetical protein BJ684DRAFT_15751 [Piptocephalis cylindrospora]
MPSFPLSNSLLLSLLLLLLPTCLATLTLTDSNNTLLAQVETQSFFQLRRPSSEHSGILVPLPLARQGNECVLGPLPPLANLTSSPRRPAKTRETIFLADWRDASECGLDTLAQLGQLALQASSALVSHSYPPPLALIILLGRQYSGVPGNPLREPYLAHSSNIVVTSQVPILMDVLRSHAFPLKPPSSSTFTPGPPLQVTLKSEEGPWNATFLSPSFLATQWILFSLNALLCIWALYQLIIAIRRKTFPRDLRNAIYLTGLLATLLLTSFLPLPMVTYSRTTMESLHAFTTNVAFLLLLLLWSRFLRRILPQTEYRQVLILRILVLLGALTAVWHLSICLIQANVFPINGRLDEFRDVSNILVPATQILIASQFLISSLHTRRRLRTIQVPLSMDRAMSRVSLLAWTFFIATLFFSIVTSQSIREHLGRPATLALYWIMTMLLNTAQNVILLCVSGIRMTAGGPDSSSPEVPGKELRPTRGDSLDSDRTLQEAWKGKEEVDDPKEKGFRLPFAWSSNKTPSAPTLTVRLGQWKDMALSKIPTRSPFRSTRPSIPPTPPSPPLAPVVQLRRPTAILAKIAEEDVEGGGRGPKVRNVDLSAPWSLAVANAAHGGLRKDSYYDQGPEHEEEVAAPEGQVPIGVILTRRPSSWGSLGNHPFRADHQWDSDEEEDEVAEEGYDPYAGNSSETLRKDSEICRLEGLPPRRPSALWRDGAGGGRRGGSCLRDRQ